MDRGFFFDGFVKKKSICCVAVHPSSLRRTKKYASFVGIRAPCLWSFLQSRPVLPVHRGILRLSFFLSILSPTEVPQQAQL